MKLDSLSPEAVSLLTPRLDEIVQILRMTSPPGQDSLDYCTREVCRAILRAIDVDGLSGCRLCCN